MSRSYTPPMLGHDKHACLPRDSALQKRLAEGFAGSARAKRSASPSARAKISPAAKVETPRTTSGIAGSSQRPCVTYATTNSSAPLTATEDAATSARKILGRNIGATECCSAATRAPNGIGPKNAIAASAAESLQDSGARGSSPHRPSAHQRFYMVGDPGCIREQGAGRAVPEGLCQDHHRQFTARWTRTPGFRLQRNSSPPGAVGLPPRLSLNRERKMSAPSSPETKAISPARSACSLALKLQRRALCAGAAGASEHASSWAVPSIHRAISHHRICAPTRPKTYAWQALASDAFLPQPPPGHATFQCEKARSVHNPSGVLNIAGFF